MKPKDLIQLAILAALIWFSVIAPRIGNPNPPIITAGPTTAPQVVQPAPVVIEQTAAPVYDIQVIEPAPAPTATEASRAGWEAPTVQTGNTGSHNPGRTDHRNP
jgi:hypothetical protein